MRREWQGNWWDKTKLALSGSNADGSDNLWGDIANTALPVILGAVSTYYTGNYQLGSKVGGLANKGLDAWTSNMLEGTDTLGAYEDETNKNEGQRAIIDTIGGVAASAYTTFGGATYGNKPKSGTRKENKALDKALEGISEESIGSFLGDNTLTEGGVNSVGAINALSKLGSNQQQKPFSANSLLDPNNPLMKFFGDMQNKMGSANQTEQNNFKQPSQVYSPSNLLNTQNTSVNGMMGDGIFSLDDKKKPKNTFDSTLQYNMFDGFANGGETKQDRKMTYRIPSFASKSNPNQDIKKKTLI